MSDRTTKRHVLAMLERLTKSTGLPLELEISSPGDGMTRYQLMVKVNELGGCTELGRVMLGAAEAYDALRLADDVVERLRRAGKLA